MQSCSLLLFHFSAGFVDWKHVCAMCKVVTYKFFNIFNHNISQMLSSISTLLSGLKVKTYSVKRDTFFMIMLNIKNIKSLALENFFIKSRIYSITLSIFLLIEMIDWNDWLQIIYLSSSLVSIQNSFNCLLIMVIRVEKWKKSSLRLCL